MIGFIARHILKFSLLMAAVSVVAFVLVATSPVDPVQANSGQAALVSMSAEKRAQLAAYWGTDLPLWQRYGEWAAAALQGDMGQSLRYNAPVADVIAWRAGNSLLLMGCAWVLSGVLGFALGAAAGLHRGGLFDQIGRAHV